MLKFCNEIEDYVYGLEKRENGVMHKSPAAKATSQLSSSAGNHVMYLGNRD